MATAKSAMKVSFVSGIFPPASQLIAMGKLALRAAAHRDIAWLTEPTLCKDILTVLNTNSDSMEDRKALSLQPVSTTVWR